MRRSRSTAQKRKPPDGWPPPRRLLTCRGTRSTSGPPMPRRGCPSTAPSTGCARSTATSPGTTNCAPKPAITVALPCTPTLRTIQGCSSENSSGPGRPCHGRPDRRGLFERTCRERQHRHQQQQERHRSEQGGEVRRVHARERRQGVPGPGRVGRVDDRWGIEWLVAGPERPGVEDRPSARARTCSHRGSRATRRSAEEQERALKFAQCIRDNGVEDFPDPAPGEPLVDTNRIPSAASSGGMAILNAAMQKCGDLVRGRNGAASEAEDVGAGRGGRPGRRNRHRRRGRRSGAKQATPAAPGRRRTP